MTAYRVVIVSVLLIAALAAIAGGAAELTRQLELGTHTARTLALAGTTSVGLSWAVIGGVIAWMRPRNRLGALMLAVGFFTQLSVAEESLARIELFGALDQDDVWAGRPAGMALSLLVGFVLYVTIGLLPALYPSGRLPSVWWHGPAAVVVAGAALLQVEWFVANRGNSVQDAARVLEFSHEAPMVLFLLGILAIWGLSIVRVARSAYPARQQLLWLLVSIILVLITQFVGDSTASLWVRLIGLYFLPVAIGIGIVRYQLLGIETILRRGLVYGALTVLVVTLYAGVSGLAGTQLTGTRLPTVVAAVLIAVGLNPLRTRLQTAVDRLVYGQRNDPMRVVSELGNQVAGTHEGELIAVLLGGVQDAVRASAVRIRQVDGTVLSQLGDGKPFETDSLTSGFREELIVGGVVVGILEVAGRGPGERYSRQDETLLRALAPQVSVVVRALQLTSELKREQEAVLAARGEERQRLRRDLHDGLGPSLTGVGLGLEALSDALQAREHTNARDIIRVLREEMHSTVIEVRRILADLRPFALAEQGLCAAIERRIASAASPIPIDVRICPLPALSPDVEEAAYLVTAEAVTNVLKHANASRAAIEMGVYDGRLIGRVTDDGIGFDEQTGPGIGLESMRGRTTALGGECQIATAGSGTTVSFAIPIGALP